MGGPAHFFEPAVLDRFHLPGAAFVEVVALLAAIVATTIAFWPKSLAAGIRMLPYLAWVTFASVLNFAIWRLNA